MLDKEKFEKEFIEASERGKERLARLPKAVSAEYDKVSKRMIFNLANEVSLIVPTKLIQGLQNGDDKSLSDFDLMLEGSQIHWHTLDVQVYVKNLLEGIFGTPKWMDSLKEHYKSIGAKGGAATSEAKKQASAENGKKGGRPKKNVA